MFNITCGKKGFLPDLKATVWHVDTFEGLTQFKNITFTRFNCLDLIILLFRRQFIYLLGKYFCSGDYYIMLQVNDKRVEKTKTCVW